MQVAKRPHKLSPTRPPWREQRAERIARQSAERDARRAERASNPARSSGKQSAVVTRADLRKQRGSIERFMAWGVLLISFIGTIVVLHGGWPAFIASFTDGPLKIGALLGGVIIQVVLTFLEWYYFDRILLAWGARLADTVLTALGYGPLFVVPLVAWLTPYTASGATALAWTLIALLSLAVAWFPESRLVD